MGLASSQARLLSLTSRQQSVEARAQRLLSDKMRLSNDSDAAYKKYMDVLEDTALKTRQTDDLGQTFWIDGNINNLMRLNAPENTGGSVFYVQDLETGKLFVPYDIFDSYNNITAVTVPTGHDYSDAMKFATLFGVSYKKIDLNEDIKIKYDQVISLGYDKALTDEQYGIYTAQTYKDSEIQSTAKILKGMIPIPEEINDTGKSAFKVQSSKFSIATNYETFVMKAMESEVYSAKDKRLLEESLRILKSIKSPADQDTGYADSVTVVLEDGTSETDEYYATKIYKDTKLSVNNGTVEYLTIENGPRELTTVQNFELMLNGGTITWDAKYDITYKDEFVEKYLNTSKNVPVQKTADIYDSTTNSILREQGTTDLGTALTQLFDRMSNYTQYSDDVLRSFGKTKNDVFNYRTFKEIQSEYALYQPNYIYEPDNRVKSTYYENMFNAINAAGGCTSVNEGTAKNATWVENMIKNAKVILTTWDNNENMLSRTSPSLNVDVKEVTDDHKVQQAEQDYEAETAFINEKDTKLDNVLNKLETERTSIKTEIDGIKKVMKDNISMNFKVLT